MTKSEKKAPTATQQWGITKLAKRPNIDGPHVLVVFLVLILLAVVLEVLYFREAPLEYMNNPIPVQVKPVVAGEDIELLISRCNNTKSEMVYHVTRHLRRADATGSVILLVPTTTSAAPGCTTVNARLHLIPPNTPPGEYVLYGVATIYDSNRVRDVPYWTEPFTVVAPGAIFNATRLQ